MRRKLIEADLIECVLGLGPNLFYNSPMEACVVVCSTQKPKARRGKILFINAVNEVTRERAQSFLSDANLQRVVRAYQEFKDEPGFTRVVNAGDIREKEWSLNISLFVVNSEHRRTGMRSSGGSLEEAFIPWLASAKTTRESLATITGSAAADGLLGDAQKLKAQLPSWLDRSKWQRIPFGEIADCIREPGQPTPEDSATYIGLEHMDTGSLHVRRWGSEADLKGQKLKMRQGDILFAKRNAYLRRVAIAPHDGFFSAHGMILRARPDKVLPEFLPFLMMSDCFMNRAVEISVGSLSPTINWTTLKLETFDLPPLDQQRRIAEILWMVNEVIDAQEALEKDTKNARKTFFENTVTDGRRAVSRGENVTWPCWREVPLSQAVEFLDGLRKPIKEADRAKRSGEYPYYGASGIIDTIDDFIFDEPLVLLGEDGANIVDRSSPLAYRVAGKIWVNNHAHVLRVRRPNSLIYVEYYLESLDYKPFVTGTAQPKLNKGVCEGIRIPLPDAKFQTEIELRLLAFEKALDSQAENLKITRKLQSSLLNQLSGTRP
jgi:restriction endonuclease S subunit